MHFGTPVVPDEYITYRGASNSTRVNSGSAPRVPKRAKVTAFGSRDRSGSAATYGITTTRSTDGSRSSTPRIGSSESIVLPE